MFNALASGLAITAERALRHLAVQRKISGAFSEKGAGDYLRLLSIAQTCRFQQKSFLGFLLSKSTNVNEIQGRQFERCDQSRSVGWPGGPQGNFKNGSSDPESKT